MTTSADNASNGFVTKLVMSAIIAAIVGGLGSLSGAGAVFIVVAVVAAVVGFWLLDAVMASAPDRAVVHSPGSTPTAPPYVGALPQTSIESLPPLRSGEPPQVDQPVDPSGVPTATDKHIATLDPALFDPQSVEITANPQGKSRIFSIRIAKHGNAITDCEDAVAIDPRRGLLAVADGASSSFGAGIWADTLAKQFIKTPPKPLSVGSFSEWLGAARTSLPELDSGSSDQPNGWWSEQGARHGAFSTVVGAAIMTDGESRVATVMCLGDSCAFVLTGPRGERIVRRSLPYEDSEQFGSHPALLGSMADRQHDEPTWTTVPTEPGDLLVLASDAVAEWLLGDPKRFLVFDGHEPDAIASRLIAERTDGKLVNDDLTIAVLELVS